MAKSNGSVPEETEIEGTELVAAGPWAEVGVASSVTRRVSGSDDMFVSVSIKLPCLVDDLEETQAKAEALCDEWLTARLEKLPDAADLEGEEGEVEEGEEGEGEGEGEAEEEGELTPDDVMAMGKEDLLALAEEYDLVADLKKLKKIAEQREFLVEALFDAEEGEGEGEEGEGEADDGENADPYTEDELKALKLQELQEITDDWGIEVDIKKGANLAAKKTAYIEAILEAQEAAE